MHSVRQRGQCRYSRGSVGHLAMTLRLTVEEYLKYLKNHKAATRDFIT